MNNAKKIMKNQEGNSKKTKKAAKYSKGKLLFVGGIALCALIILVVCIEQFRPRVLATVGDDKVYLQDAMYDIYVTEMQHNSMGDLYKQLYGSDYWSMEVDDEGTTGAEEAMQSVKDAVERRAVLSTEAIGNSLTVSSEEKKTIAEQVKSLREGMTKAQKAMPGLSEAKLTEVLENQLLADKFKQDMKNSYEVDEDAIRKTVDKKENRQYDLQYYHVSTQTTDENNNTVEKSDAERETLRLAMMGHYEQAKTAKDFTKLVGSDEKNGIEFKTENLVEKDTDFLTEDIRKKLKKLKNGELSEFIETDHGYYFFKMINNNSTEAYEEAVQTAIDDKKNELFEEDYPTIANSYLVQMNEKQWDKIDIGSYTTE